MTQLLPLTTDRASHDAQPHLCPPPQPQGWTRRMAMRLLGAAGLAATGLGTAVGFAPSPAAAAGYIPSCDFGRETLSGCLCRGTPSCYCIGSCSTTTSSCQFGARSDLDYCLVTNLGFSAGGARPVGVCNNGPGWCCGVYC